MMIAIRYRAGITMSRYANHTPNSVTAMGQKRTAKMVIVSTISICIISVYILVCVYE